jgi:hypothetical protein
MNRSRHRGANPYQPPLATRQQYDGIGAEEAKKPGAPLMCTQWVSDREGCLYPHAVPVWGVNTGTALAFSVATV